VLAATVAAPAAAAGLVAAKLSAPPSEPPEPAHRLRMPVAARLQFREAAAAIGGVLAVIVWLLILDGAGLSENRQHTVLVVAALGLAATISTASTRGRVAVWGAAALGALLLIPAPTSGLLDFAHFAHLTPVTLLLGLAGSGFGMLGIIGARKTMLEPALAERSDH
jgi:hypothetical protein